MIKKLALIVVASLFVTVLYPANKADADPVSEVKSALEGWAPSSVVKSGATIKVVLPQRRITQTIFTAAISAGLCPIVAFKKFRLAGVREIQILNQFGAQGYVFEGGKKQCEEIANAPLNMVEIRLLGMTHLYP